MKISNRLRNVILDKKLKRTKEELTNEQREEIQKEVDQTDQRDPHACSFNRLIFTKEQLFDIIVRDKYMFGVKIVE